MSKRLSAIIAAATLGLSAAAFAQTSTPSTQSPSAAPPSTSGTGTMNAPANRTGTTTQSGTATNKAMSEAEVRKELEKQGYTRVSDVKKKGDHYEAKGVKDGKTVSLDVDAKSGKVVAR